MKRLPPPLTALVATLGLIATAQADRSKPPQTVPVDEPTPAQFSAALRGELKTNGIFKQLQALQDIADANDGNRAAGQPGFKASTKYVASQLKDYGWDVTR